MRTVRRDVEPVAEPGDPGPASISPVRPAPIRRPTSCSPSRRPSGCRLRPQPSGAGLRGRTSRRTSWSAGVPSVEGPGLPDEATYGDDRVGEVEEGVDHVFFAFVAALQPVEGVVPGIRAFDVPPVGGLDGGFDDFAGDLAGQVRSRVAGRVRVGPSRSRRPGATRCCSEQGRRRRDQPPRRAGTVGGLPARAAGRRRLRQHPLVPDVLAEPAWSGALTAEDRRGLTPLFWTQIAPYGEVKLNMGKRLEVRADAAAPPV